MRLALFVMSAGMVPWRGLEAMAPNWNLAPNKVFSGSVHCDNTVGFRRLVVTANE